MLASPYFWSPPESEDLVTSILFHVSTVGVVQPQTLLLGVEENDFIIDETVKLHLSINSMSITVSRVPETNARETNGGLDKVL